MNREIRFRAFFKGEMFQLDQITTSAKAWTCENGRGVSLIYQSNIPVMQFTGLSDKNGREIYEGDICETYTVDDGKLIDKVIFERGSFLFQCDKKLSLPIGEYKTDYIEVIGNIYETPQLLK